MDQLVIIDGPGKGQWFPLVAPISHVIGRDRLCDVRVESSRLSRRHARIYWDVATYAYYVEDLGSASRWGAASIARFVLTGFRRWRRLPRTFINDQEITRPTRLMRGDLIRVGDVTFRLEPGVAAEMTAPAGPCDPQIPPSVRPCHSLAGKIPPRATRNNPPRMHLSQSSPEEKMLDAVADATLRSDPYAAVQKAVRRELAMGGVTPQTAPCLRELIDWKLLVSDVDVPAERWGAVIEQIHAELVAKNDDTVRCTVFAPAGAAVAETILVQVFAHTPQQAGKALDLAKEFDAQAQRRGFKNLAVPMPLKSLLTVHLVMPGLEVDPAVQELTWNGKPAAVQFSVSVPATHRAGAVIGTVTIGHEGAPLGHIKFKLDVVSARAKPTRLEPCGEAACRYRKAFVSYASADRVEVLKRVQLLQRVGIECFQDVLNLEPGSRWEKELYRHIDESDLFLLFWSTPARASQWVRQELLYALQRRAGNDMAPPEIMPVVIEGPPPPPPPEELRHLHFNDYFLYLLAGQRQVDATRGAGGEPKRPRPPE
jgi:hypothetical protein